MDRRRFCQTTIGAAVAASLPTGQSFASYLQALTTVAGDIDAITGDGAERILKQAEVQELSDSLRGRLLLPGNDGYDTARHVLNGSIDKYPALIVQPSGATDIGLAVDYARENSLLTAVKCGGHSTSGKSTCDGGLQIDLSSYRNVEVDRKNKIAHVAGGSLLGDMDHETMTHGLVTTAGTVSHTGVGGLTTGGGFGRVGRRFGLALDNVMAVDIVTADGQIRRASKQENPDLYWGVRGGGGNFGVVTNFDFKLHPMQRTVVGGDILFPLAEARDILRFFAEYYETIPDEHYADIGLISSPGGEGDFVMIHLCYSGPEKDASKWVDPIRNAGTAVVDNIKAMDYVAIQQLWDQTDPRATASYMKAGFIAGISDDVIDSMLGGFEPHPARATQAFLFCCGGAIGRVPADATAFAHRYANHDLFAAASWLSDASQDAHIAYIRQYWTALEQFTKGFYVNDYYEASQETVNKNYQGNYERLVAVKNKYDPTNLFRLNANVVPTV
jgi:FAD binding domain/Berberine and berberine like